jgi:hypothetical protein
MTQIIVFCVLALSICGSAIAAEPSENGRYQAVTIEKGGAGLTPEVLILDTREGHVWRYWQEPRMEKAQGSEGVKYIMQIRPEREAWRDHWVCDVPISKLDATPPELRL